MPDATLRVSIDSSQLLALANRFKSVGLGNVLQKAVNIFALEVERGSKIASPIDTGRLRSSINTSIGNLQARVAPHTNYAFFVHEGTRYMKGRPFMGIGLESAKVKYFGARSELVSQIEVELNKSLK